MNIMYRNAVQGTLRGRTAPSRRVLGYSQQIVNAESIYWLNTFLICPAFF